MSKVTFITPSEETIVIENTKGNLMSIAVANQIEGVGGDCGGVCSCATCHVHIAREWMDRVGPASESEKGMLELEDEATDCSRLGCQVDLIPELDGLVVKVVGQ